MKNIKWIILIIIAGSAGLYYFSQNKIKNSPQLQSQTENEAQKKNQLPDYKDIQLVQTIIKDLQVGDGNKVTHKSRVKVAYKAWIYAPSQIANKGTFLFEAQMDRPMEFTLGDNRAIKGLEKGLINMKVSGKRELIIPAAEAYGDVGDGDKIPPGAILLFEVQLLEASEV